MLRDKIKGVFIVFTICIVFSAIILQLPYDGFAKQTAGERVQYIIDPGHGIPDGGAVASDDTTEQELNLAIGIKVKKLLEKKKISAILTRMDENSIYTEGETIHAKKVSDIKNRIAIASKYKNIPFISIHLNTFSDSSVSGIQVFYKDGDENSLLMARKLQDAFNKKVQPNGPKVIKPISKSIYLFSHIDNPAILIECGFLSNTAELKKLKTDEYQQTIAKIIADTLVTDG